MYICTTLLEKDVLQNILPFDLIIVFEIRHFYVSFVIDHFVFFVWDPLANKKQVVILRNR